MVKRFNLLILLSLRHMARPHFAALVETHFMQLMFQNIDLGLNYK